jgi:hypothetical protein
VTLGPTVSHLPTDFLARHGIDPRGVVSIVNDFVQLPWPNDQLPWPNDTAEIADSRYALRAA